MIIDPPEFVDREKEKETLKRLLSGRPNFVYFIYGPINSGKTALLNQVFKELPDNYRIFYINFRGFEGGYKKFTRSLFELGDTKLWEKLKTSLPILSAILEYSERVIQKFNSTIPLPAEVIRMIHIGDDEEEKIDLFHYLEKLMEKLNQKNLIPVLVFDELQVIKDELNTTGTPLLGRLFNFLVRMTKETHLCHSLCATSDCLFIENIYTNARLEGRAKYLLVDDLDKNRALKVYEEFNFQNKELIWEYIGGKFGDILNLFEEKKIGLSENEAIQEMLKTEKGRLSWLFKSLKLKEKQGPSVEKLTTNLTLFKKNFLLPSDKIDDLVLKFLIQENILFYNPLENTVRPQSKLLWHAIKELI